jgi:beta-lactam-binding protein with PASTA domain
LRGQNAPIADETEITQSFRTVEEERPAEPPPGRSPLDAAGPWLGALAALAVIGFLVWFFGFRSHGGSGHVVPGVVGLQERAAIARLNGDGYDVQSIHEPLRRPRGVVGAQAPGGGSRLPTSETVTIHVSTGRAPAVGATTATTATTTATTTAATTTLAAAPAAPVPDVTGQDMVSAAGQVEAAGFVAQTEPVEAPGTPGSVVQEDPPGGTQGKVGETVTLAVAVGSSRPSAQIPDVTGETAASARAALLQATLTVRTTYRKGKPGVVLAQSSTGTAPAYTQVAIAVGR